MPKITVRNARDLKGQKIERSVIIERAAVDQEARTVTLAFASENPVERWGWVEILDCKPSSVRLDRLLSGGPLLLGHDPDDQIGVVESVSVGEDGVCRAVCRFSRAVEAEEIFQDVIDGIRRNVSVGYMIHECVMESQTENTCTYRITDWEPYEVSLVPMPADISVGVGRSANHNTPEPPAPEPPKKETRTMNKCKSCGAELAEGATCTCTAVRAAEQKRVGDIMARAAEFSERNGIAVATKLLTDTPGATVEDFNARMLEEITKTQAPTVPRAPEQQRSPIITTDLRYDERSLEPWKKAGHSRESSVQQAYTAGMWALAVIYGNERARSWCVDNGLNLRAMAEGSGSSGGFLVPEQMSTAIIDFRLQYGAARKLAQLWPMASATCTVPVTGTGPTAYFSGENASLTPSDLGLSQVELVAKKLTALTLLSKEVVEDAVIDLAALVADRQGYAFAGKEDACLTDGDGTSAYGGIIGLKSKLETSGMKGIYTAATNTDTPQEIIAAEISGLMAKLPSYARSGAGFLTSPTFDELIFGRLLAAGGGNTVVTLSEGNAQDQYLRRPRWVCETCYSDETADLTGKAMAFYGNFKLGVIFGERRGMQIEVLRERYADQDSIGIKGTERVDINCHGVGSTTAAGPIVALIGG